MKRSVVAAVAGASLAFCSAGSQAGAAKAPDTGKLNATDVYVSVPRDQIFVESFDFTAPNVAQQLSWGKLIAYNFLSVLGGGYSANQIDYRKAQQRGYAIHGLLDSYDGGSVLRGGTDQTIKSLLWLHPKHVQVTSDEIGQPSLPPSGVDSVLILQLYYSVTPDFRAVVVAGSLKLYSPALSPPLDPYDPSSKSLWLRKPVATREYIYQSKLLQLPDKTPAVIEQLSAAVDRAFDAKQLQEEFDAIPVGSRDMVDKRTMDITEKEQAYQRVLKDIKDPVWHDDDANLMYALMWSADDDNMLKQAVQDGVASLSDLITRSISAIPPGAKVVAQDNDGKDALFMVSKTAERTIYVDNAGLVFSASQDDTSHVEMVFPPWGTN